MSKAHHDEPYIERTGGSYEKQPDGSLRRLEEPTKSEAPVPPSTEPASDKRADDKKGK